MTMSLLEDAFAHHVWASLRVLDVCLELDQEQLGTTVPGTYGSILDTVRHLVGSDAWYLFRVTGDPSHRIDEDHMDLAELRPAMEGHGAVWSQILAQDLDPDAILVGRNDDGSETHAATGIRLAQALHHGTDHRSQICTALTALGVEPPAIDVWDFGVQDGPRHRGPTYILTSSLTEGTGMATPTSVDDYLAALPEEPRAALEALRKTIKAAAPEATETISYQMPAFKDHGRFLVSYAAFKDHCSLFPASEAVLEALGEQMKPYLSGKGTIRFRASKPLPAALVKKIVKKRLEENAALRGR